jgi:ribosomal protein L31
MENWRGYLSEEDLDESLMLKKGKNGWWLYSKLVAEAYRTAPDLSKELTPRYEEFGRWLEDEVARIKSRVKVVPTEKHPYSSARQMRDEVGKTGKLFVSTSDATHPAWTGEQGLKWNTYFRAFHDFQGHIGHGSRFSLQGEIASYNNHARMIPNDYVPLLFTEVVGQISCFYHSAKDNCPQKVTILDDFDFFKVGLLTKKGEERVWEDGKRYRVDLDKQSPTYKLLISIGDNNGSNI